MEYPGFKIPCFIVEDQADEMEYILDMVKGHPGLELVKHYTALPAAMNFMEAPHLWLLDVEVGEEKSIRFYENIPEGILAEAVFITSHPAYAVDAFNIDAIDFLVKPYAKERFYTAIDRAFHYMALRYPEHFKKAGLEEIIIKDGYAYHKIKPGDILYVEALKDYTVIVTSLKKFYKLQNLKNFLLEFENDLFRRVHKSYAVPLQQVISYSTKKIVLNNGIEIPLGRSYKDAFIDAMENRI